MAETKAQATEEKKLNDLVNSLDLTNYKLMLLCSQFEKDKDMVLKEGVDIKSVIKILQTEIAAFAKMRGEIGKILEENIEQAAEKVVEEADRSIKQALNDNVEHTIRRLDTEVDKANTKFQYFYDLDKKRVIWMILGLIILPVVTGCFVAKIFMSDPIMKFNKVTCGVYMDRCINYDHVKH
jgi:hypothetical protein